MKRIASSVVIGLVLMTSSPALRAQNGIWTNAASGGLWSGTANWLNGSVANASGNTANFNQVHLVTDPTVVHLDTTRTIGSLIFGDLNPGLAAGWLLDNNATVGNVLTLAGTSAITVNRLPTGKVVTVNTVVAGTVGLTKQGNGALTLGGATDTFTGGLKDNAGTLTLDFNASGSPASTLVPSQVLTMGGGALNFNGNAGTASSQSFTSTTFNPGLSTISAAPASGANIPTVSLGALTANYGAVVRYIGPATIDSNGSPVAATATIKTTTVGSSAASLGVFLAEGPNAANPTAAYATVGLYDWASTSLASGAAGASPYTVIGGSQVAGFYSTAWVANGNIDVVANNQAINNNSYAPTIRFNNPAAPNAASGGGGNLTFGGLLVTPALGAVNASLTGGGGWQIARISSVSAAQTGVIWQNNILGYFNMTPAIGDGRQGTSSPTQIIKAGDGTVVFASGSSYSGQTYVNGGTLVISANSAVGSLTSVLGVNLNGGTLLGNATFALDNGGTTPKRPITLLGNGGGLAAAAGTTMTVDGVVGGAAGTGPLVIGLPASSANGNVPGLLPGSGSVASGQSFDTANLTPVFATGTVVLNSGGNTFAGGALITGGATLNINSEWALGGSVYTGLAFNNGTLQYNSLLLNSTTDISQNSAAPPVAQTVTFAGNATVDVNGQNVAFTNSIGNGGPGALTVFSTAANGVLTLLGANNYSGGTIVTNVTLLINNTSGSGTGSGAVTVAGGATLGGTGTIAGNIAWQPGSAARFTAGAPMTAGAVTLNGNPVTINVPGGTPLPIGTYVLLNYTVAGSTGAFATGTPAFTGAGVASGTVSSIATAGGTVTLTVASGGAQAAWVVDANGNWTVGTNWSSNPSVPHAAGDLATLGVGSAMRTVTLNAGESVGGLALTNANSFVVANGGSALTLDNNGHGATVVVTAGTANAIQAAVALNDTAQVTVAAGSALAISGSVSNRSVASKTLTVNGTGTTVLSGANSYGPAAGSVGTILTGGGTLQVANADGLGAGDVSVAGSSTLQAGAPGLSLANNLALAFGATATVDNNGNNLTLAGTLGGSGALTKVGNGTLALQGNNLFTGNTTINAGILSLNSPNNVANSALILLEGGDLLGNGSFLVTNSIDIGAVAGSTGGLGFIDAAGGQIFTVAGTIASAGNTGVNALTVNSAGGTGTLVLSGANSFTGATSISNGVLQLANPLALANSTLNYNRGTVLFDPAITSATLGELAGTSAAVSLGLTNLAGAPVTLTVGNNNANTLFAGNLTGSGSLSEWGTGTLALSDATYAGNTVVYSGGLLISSPSSLNSHLDISGQYGQANVTLNGASLTSPNGLYITSPTGGSGSGTYGSLATLTITNGAQVTANADGNGRALSYGNGQGRPGGTGSLTIGTPGDTTTLVTVNGALDMFYTSGGSTVGNFALNLNGGTLAVQNFQESTWGSQSGAIYFNGGTLAALTGDVGNGFFPNTPAQLTAVVNAGGAIVNDKGNSITFNAGLLHGTGSPDGGLTKLGTGTVTLNGANTYTGNTTISTGTLALGSSGSLASGHIAISSGAIFDVTATSGFNLVVNQSLGNSTSPGRISGSVTTGPGIVSLVFSNGSPSLTIANGTLTLAGGTYFNINNPGPALGLGTYLLVTNDLSGTGFITGQTPTNVTVTGNGVVTNTYPSLEITNGAIYLAIATGSITNPVVYPPVMAFPGALGYGANATGGRGGSVYHVTTLADSGPGSFRDAVSRGGRTIVFDVGGYINLDSAVSAASGLTIAGQTAPGGGIGLMGNELSFYGKNNVICRFLRVRQGGSSTGSSGINIGSGNGYASNMIFDHTSVEFGQWDSFDAVHTTDFTIQYCIIADPINQQFGAHVEGGNASYFNNLWVNAHNRQPLAKASTVYINNVIYDFQAGYTVANTAGHFSHDIVNNYFITGPSSTSPNSDFFQFNNNQTIYAVGNMLDSSRDGVLNGGPSEPGSGIVSATPWSPVTATIPTVSAQNAYRIDVSSAGALPSDLLDAQVISQVTSFGTAGRIIVSPADTGLPNNGYGTINSGTAPVDSDQDGMPDVWEIATGSNPYAADNNVVAPNGYTLLENYLAWLAAPHAFVQTNATDLDLWPYTLGFTNGASYTFSAPYNGTLTLTNSHFARFVPTAGYTGLAGFTFVVANNDGSSMTNTMGLLVTTLYTPKNLVWQGDGSANVWDTTNTADWLTGGDSSVFTSGDNVTFDNSGSASPAINLTGAVAPGGVVVVADQDYTFGGGGGISGNGGLTKSGAGTLTVNNNNTFIGPVNLNAGTLQLNDGGTLGGGTINLQSGTLANHYSAGNYLTLANPLAVPTNAFATINLGYDINLTGTLTGAGTLNLNVQSAGATDQYKGNGSGFAGTINLVGAGGLRLVANGGAFSGFNNALTTINAPVTLGFYNNSGGNTYYFGGLSGTNPAAALYDYYAGAPTLQIGALNLNTTFAGQFQTSVNLVKIGTGTLTLSGSSTHTGTTTVSSGTLAVTGSFSSSPVTVNSGTTLAGNGVLGGGLTVQSGGTVAPSQGTGGFGTLTVSNSLSLTTPQLDFDLSSSPAGVNDSLWLPGATLTQSGVQTYHFNLVNNALGAGIYTLIGGALANNSGGSFATDLPPNTRQNFTLQNSPAGVQLAVTGNAGSLVWRGTNGSNWDVASTPNWLNGTGVDLFYNLDVVRFDDSSTNGNVSISGVAQPAAVLVTNNAVTYTIGGGVLGGFASLVKAGPGQLILNSSNSYAGGTYVNGGTLQLVNNAFAGGVGPILLNGGTLYLNGVGSGAVITTTGANQLATYGQPYASFNLQGSGYLNLNIGGGGVFSPGGDWSSFAGTIYFSTGNGIRILGPTVFGSAAAVWDLGPNGSIYNKSGGLTNYLGALFGGTNASLSGATTVTASLTTYVVGGINTNSLFNGVISDGGAAPTALIYNGPGSLTLAGNNTFSGGTTVNAGTLLVNSLAGSGTGLGVVSLNPGATLGGNGAIGGQVTMAAGAILAPGSNGAGILTVTNDLGLNNASVLQFQLGTTSDQVAVTGNLTLGGILNFGATTGFGPGTYTLFTYGGSLSLGSLAFGTVPAGFSYTLDTSVAGQVNVMVTAPHFGSVQATVNGLVLSGSGGTPHSTYYVLTATNLATPLANWTRVLTNQFDAIGHFNLTNAYTPQTPRRFYQLEIP